MALCYIPANTSEFGMTSSVPSDPSLVSELSDRAMSCIIASSWPASAGSTKYMVKSTMVLPDLWRDNGSIKVYQLQHDTNFIFVTKLNIFGT